MPEMQQDAAHHREFQQTAEDAAGEIRAHALMAAAGYSVNGSYADEIEPEDLEPQPLSPESRRRVVAAIVVLVILGLAAVLPPLINVSRYQRRIATSIGASLGRPVHLDSITLNILPVPGFTLTNFVVSEDPAFGYEPVIRAGTVRANLRLRSLWRGKVEFSRIALDEPSVNLIRRADGHWNIENILLQAARMPAIPTAQAPVAGAQRFPYIEATGARVNVMQGLEKKPLSLTDADFALWLADPDTWRLRLEAHPTRTDTAATDTGTMRFEGTLGKAAAIQDVPVDLQGEWSGVPLGAASWVMMGRDAGLRGELTVRASLKGTVGENSAFTRVEVRRLRRADFVPPQTLDEDVECRAKAEGLFHQLSNLQCNWPGEAKDTGLTLTGEVPDARDWRSAQVEGHWNGVPLSALMTALRVASTRDSSALHASGILSGGLMCCDRDVPLLTSGNFDLAQVRVAVDGRRPIVSEASGLGGELADGTLTLTPIPLNLGGTQPATLSVSADQTALRMHLAGPVVRTQLLALGRALPQFGDGLAETLPAAPKTPETPIKLDLTATRPWGGPQTWSPAPHAVAAKKHKRR